MNPLFIPPILEVVKTLVQRIFPDKEKQAEAELELLKLQESGDLQKMLEQLKVNANEASHASIFVAGWRPFVGWTSGVSMAYHSLVYPILEWAAKVNGWTSPPAVDMELMLYVLGAMLGIGGLRTAEKIRKVA